MAQLGFLKHVSPDVHVENFTASPSSQVNKLQKSRLKLGLRIKTPCDGRKRPKGQTTNTPFKDKIQAVHVECEGAMKSITAKHIKTVLASPLFKQRYSCEVRLVPPLDRNASPYIQDKIKKCITQHSQWCKCVTSNTCEGITQLDQRNGSLKKNLRQLIIGLPDAHFININLNWSNSAYAIIYPRKHEKEAKERIANLGPYLHESYGDNILSSFDAEMQQLIKETTRDEKTCRPQSKLDLELDDILASGDTMDYVDMTLLEDNSVCGWMVELLPLLVGLSRRNHVGDSI